MEREEVNLAPDSQVAPQDCKGPVNGPETVRRWKSFLAGWASVERQTDFCLLNGLNLISTSRCLLIFLLAIARCKSMDLVETLMVCAIANMVKFINDCESQMWLGAIEGSTCKRGCLTTCTCGALISPTFAQKACRRFWLPFLQWLAWSQEALFSRQMYRRGVDQVDDMQQTMALRPSRMPFVIQAS